MAAPSVPRQVLAGCARMIADASITTETGKKDYTALVLSLQGLSPQAAKQAEEAGREAARPTPQQSQAMTDMSGLGAPFDDPILDAQARVLHTALSQVNPQSIRDDVEFYVVAYDKSSLFPPDKKLSRLERAQHIKASAVKRGLRNAVTDAQAAEVGQLVDNSGFKTLAYGHTHSAPSPTGGSELMSTGDIGYAKIKGLNAALATPEGKFLFYVLKEDKIYDATAAYGAVPTR